MSSSHQRNKESYNQTRDKYSQRYDKSDKPHKYEINDIKRDYRDRDNSKNYKTENRTTNFKQEEKKSDQHHKEKYRKYSASSRDSYSPDSYNRTRKRKSPSKQRRSRSRGRSEEFSSGKSSPRKKKEYRSPSSSSSYKAIKRSPKNKQQTQIKKSDQFIQQKEISPYQINQTMNIPSEFNQQPKFEKELSNTLMVAELGPDINLDVLEEIFNEKCIQIQTSMPEDIRFLESLRVAYVIFPSIPVATKLYELSGGVIYINGNNYKLEFTPNLNNYVTNPTTNKSITYITNVSEFSPYTTAMETTVHEDWICEFCDCKNFSKRTACFKCKKPKTINCRIIPVIKQKTTVMGDGGQVPPSTSLMIRGNILKETNETELLEIFSQYAQVKDIRVISDKISGEPKDFAFIEYFTIEEATMALNQIKRNPIKIRNNITYVTFSKIRRPEDFKEMNESYRTTAAFGTDNSFAETSQLLSMGAARDPSMYSGINFNTQNQQLDPYFASNTDAISTINPLNLTLEDQSKFASISNLQNKIQQIKNAVPSSNLKDTRGESNLRREKEPTEREKIESEMKKWNKKIEKQKNNLQGAKSSGNRLKNAVLNFEYNSGDNNYETVVSLDNQIQFQNQNLNVDINQNQSQYISNEYSHVGDINQYNQSMYNQNLLMNIPSQLGGEMNISVPPVIAKNEELSFICHICQRKFPSEEKLRTHENLSTLHKENLKKQTQT